MTIKYQIERLTNLRNSLRDKLRGMSLVGASADLEDCVNALNGVTVHGYTFSSITDANVDYTIPKGYYPSGSIVGVRDNNLKAENIKPGVSILGVKSTMPTATLAISELTIDSSSGTVTAIARITGEGYAPQGLFDTGIKFLSVADTDLKPENIKKGVTIFGVTGTYDPQPTGPYSIVSSFSAPDEWSLLLQLNDKGKADGRFLNGATYELKINGSSVGTFVGTGDLTAVVGSYLLSYNTDTIGLAFMGDPVFPQSIDLIVSR